MKKILARLIFVFTIFIGLICTQDASFSCNSKNNILDLSSTHSIEQTLFNLDKGTIQPYDINSEHYILSKNNDKNQHKITGSDDNFYITTTQTHNDIFFKLYKNRNILDLNINKKNFFKYQETPRAP